MPSRQRASVGRVVRMALVACVMQAASACSDFAEPDAYGLRLVALELNSEALSELRHGVYTETPVPCRVTLDGVSRRCRIAVAGATTRDDLKKNFDLELLAPHAVGRRHRLSAMDGDPSGLRALLAFDVFERAGLSTPDAEPVSLWLNRSYLGLYLLIEPIDEDFFERRNDKPVALYKARKLQATLDASGNLADAFAVRIGDGSYADLKELMLRVKQGAEPSGLTDLDQLIDRDNFISYMAASAFINHWDGIFNNYHLARSELHPTFEMLPWDLDQTFGSIVVTDSKDLFEPNALMRLLYGVAHSDYLAELQRIDGTLPVARTQRLIDTLSSQIAEAFQHDPVLASESLVEQAARLKRRAERQHELLAE